jgi:hypothetical protein
MPEALVPQMVDPNSLEGMISARLPYFPNPRVMEYVTYRAAGFGIREACQLTGVSQATLNNWRKKYPEFAKVESEQLPDLQRKLGPDVTRLTFLRNFMLALKADEKVLFKAACTIAALTANELDYLKVARRHYSPQDLVALQRAIEPESGGLGGAVPPIVVIMDGEMLVEEAARRAAAKVILDRFTANKELAGGNGDSGD